MKSCATIYVLEEIMNLHKMQNHRTFWRGVFIGIYIRFVRKMWFFVGDDEEYGVQRIESGRSKRWHSPLFYLCPIESSLEGTASFSEFSVWTMMTQMDDVIGDENRCLIWRRICIAIRTNNFPGVQVHLDVFPYPLIFVSGGRLHIIIGDKTLSEWNFRWNGQPRAIWTRSCGTKLEASQTVE